MIILVMGIYISELSVHYIDCLTVYFAHTNPTMVITKGPAQPPYPYQVRIHYKRNHNSITQQL